MTDMAGDPAGDKVRVLLEQSLQHHQAGRLEQARAGYRGILDIQPAHGDALHMLGVLAYQAGDFSEAAALITRAAGVLPPNPGVHINLGNVLQASGDPAAAVTEFRKAIDLAPGNAVAFNNLGNALRLTGRAEEAVDAFGSALSVDDAYVDAYVNLAMTLQSISDLPGATRAYERAVELDPSHESAAHMLAALRGDITEAAPQAHVAHLFDEYASRFDHHLVDTLGYSMPGLLREEIGRIAGDDRRFGAVIDLGCGTGLAGVAFRSLAQHMTGIDLSPRMVERARDRGVYDELLTGDIVDVLAADTRRFDLLLCADVFPYIGNVEPLFRTVAQHAGPGALFAFSTELNEADGYVLRPSGRYAHTQAYLREQAAAAGFGVSVMRTENLRKQQDAWIPGDLVVLEYAG